MKTLFSIYAYVVYGVIGLLILSLVMVLALGIRSRKRWGFEAKFTDMSEREFGKFHIELSGSGKKATGYSFKATLRMRHEALDKGQPVQVYLDDILVMQGNVSAAGRIFLRVSAAESMVEDPEVGQVCRVVWGGIEQFRAPIKPD